MQAADLAGVGAEPRLQTGLAREAGMNESFVREHHIIDGPYPANVGAVATVGERVGERCPGMEGGLVRRQAPVHYPALGARVAKTRRVGSCS